MVPTLVLLLIHGILKGPAHRHMCSRAPASGWGSYLLLQYTDTNLTHTHTLRR